MLVVEPVVMAEGGPRRRDVAGVLVLVAGRHDDGDAAVGHPRDRVVGRLGGAAAQRHVRHRRAGGVVRDPVHARDDAGVGAGAVAAEDADGDHGGLLRHAVGGARDGAGDVRAVAVAVGGAAAVVDGRVARGGAAGELRVGGQDAGVDDVGLHTGAVVVVGVRAAQRQVALVDAVQAPGGVALGGAGAHDLVLLDVRHRGVLADLGEGGGVHPGRVALQAGEPAVDLGALGRRPLGGVLGAGGRRLVLEHDDVAALDRRRSVDGGERSERRLRGGSRLSHRPGEGGGGEHRQCHRALTR